MLLSNILHGLELKAVMEMSWSVENSPEEIKYWLKNRTIRPVPWKLFEHPVGVPMRGFCALGRKGPQYPLQIVKGDKKGQRSEKLYLQAVWKELLIVSRT